MSPNAKKSVSMLALIAGLFPMTPHAQDASQTLEEITVTARRRVENVQTVPIAVTVVSQKTLEDNNVRTFSDLRQLVPSMTTSMGIGRDTVNISIRGQGTSGLGTQPGVVAYLNEVPLPVDQDSNLTGGPGLFFDLENVQALEGPQGTLFGRSSVGGAVLLQSARPKNELGGYLEGGYGNYNNREISAVVNVPIVSDKLLARLAFTGDRRDGFTHILSTPSHPAGLDGDGRDFWTVRGSITFRPTEWLRNDTIVTWSHYITTGGSPLFLRIFNPAGLAASIHGEAALFAEQQALGIRTNIGTSDDIASSAHYLFVNNLTETKLNETVRLRNIFGYTATKISVTWDEDGSPLVIFDQPSTPRESPGHQYSDELQLLGNSFDDHLNWIVGGFYLDTPYPGDFIVQTGRVFGGIPNDSSGTGKSASKAIFAQGTYAFGGSLAGLKLTAGVRYTRDSLASQVISTAAPGNLCTGPHTCTFAGLPVDPIARSAASSAVTWTYGLDYQLAPETLTYVTSRRGYRPGGITVTSGFPDYQPEYVTDYEIGVKSDWSLVGMPLRTNAALYYQDYSDIQVQKVVSGPGGQPTNFTTNAAAARLWGAELEATLRPTRHLQIGVNFDYLDMKFTRFDPGVDSASLLATETKGRPPYRYGISAQYQLPVAPQLGELSMNANWSWQDKNGDTSDPGGVIPSYGLLNLSANWASLFGTSIDATLYATNVLDKDYVVGVLPGYALVGFSVAAYGEPRMYGFRLKYRFGGAQ